MTSIHGNFGPTDLINREQGFYMVEEVVQVDKFDKVDIMLQLENKTNKGRLS